jgi:hypothetical protein
MPKDIDIEELLAWTFHEEKVESTRNPPDDALAVYWAVMALPEPFSQLVRNHARTGRPPDWRFDATSKVVHLAAVRYWRDRYTQWHRALTVLQRTLNGSLRNYAATGPIASQQPWHVARSAASGTPRQAHQ